MEFLDPSMAGPAAIIVLVAQLVGKLIPDEVGGVWGFVRSAAKLIGLYVQNRK
jgi:hypothetical protein